MYASAVVLCESTVFYKENQLYDIAVKELQERLKEVPPRNLQNTCNALVDSLLVYTTEHQLKEYFCLSCTKGCSVIVNHTFITK